MKDKDKKDKLKDFTGKKKKLLPGQKKLRKQDEKRARADEIDNALNGVGPSEYGHQKWRRDMFAASAIIGLASTMQPGFDPSVKTDEARKVADALIVSLEAPLPSETVEEVQKLLLLAETAITRYDEDIALQREKVDSGEIKEFNPILLDERDALKSSIKMVRKRLAS